MSLKQQKNSMQKILLPFMDMVAITFKKTFAHEKIQWVEQAEQLGTGHAVQMTLPVLPQEGSSLILSGDVPLVSQNTLEKLLKHQPKQVLAYDYFTCRCNRLWPYCP